MKLEILTKSDNDKIQNLIISKIRDLINYKNLEPGDKLPSERMMSEKFETSRSNVREAIQKLEFYGLLKSIPNVKCNKRLGKLSTCLLKNPPKTKWVILDGKLSTGKLNE